MANGWPGDKEDMQGGGSGAVQGHKPQQRMGGPNPRLKPKNPQF